MAKILISPSKYLQGAGEMKKIGTYASNCGKKALVLISKGGYKRIGKMIEDSFAESTCEVVFDYFNGECCNSEIDRLVNIVKENQCDLVIGIGGSYLGARAAIEFLSHSFYNVLPKGKRKTPEIYFVGNSISSKYIHDLMDLIDGKDFSINIISKSGTTTEPAIAFRVFKEMLIEKYGKEEANKRIYATTDRARGALKNLANEEGYESRVSAYLSQMQKDGFIKLVIPVA